MIRVLVSRNYLSLAGLDCCGILARESVMSPEFWVSRTWGLNKLDTLGIPIMMK